MLWNEYGQRPHLAWPVVTERLDSHKLTDIRLLRSYIQKFQNLVALHKDDEMTYRERVRSAGTQGEEGYDAISLLLPHYYQESSKRILIKEGISCCIGGFVLAVFTRPAERNSMLACRVPHDAAGMHNQMHRRVALRGAA